VAAVHRRPDGARGASGGDRGERGDRSERAPRSSGPSPRREKVDPWFLKPYEPSAAPVPTTSKPSNPSIKPAKQKVAALLGGLPKQQA
jgi:hypothetical protein